jgi:hypothetical protein
MDVQKSNGLQDRILKGDNDVISCTLVLVLMFMPMKQGSFVFCVHLFSNARCWCQIKQESRRFGWWHQSGFWSYSHILELNKCSGILHIPSRCCVISVVFLALCKWTSKLSSFHTATDHEWQIKLLLCAITSPTSPYASSHCFLCFLGAQLSWNLCRPSSNEF